MDPRKVADQIGAFVVATVLKVKATGCVIGLSGGVDSSTTAALVKRAFESLPGRSLELLGLILPSSVNQMQDAADAESLARWLGVRHELIPIDAIVDVFRRSNPEAFESFFHKGNLMSRVRANVLATRAATEKKLVAGTGNKDEDFGIGYYTLFGDGAVHFSPIAGLSKRLVREMARFLGLPENIVQRPPTAGLEPGQSDLRDLGYDYEVVELVIEAHEQGFGREQLIAHKQLVALVERQLEQYRSTFGDAKFQSVAAVVDDVLKRHAQARLKMEIIHPPAPQVTLVYKQPSGKQSSPKPSDKTGG
jgi:NAD+ synthase